jgi:acyl-coenzyme A thioesterase PaaI-like protein
MLYICRVLIQIQIKIKIMTTTASLPVEFVQPIRNEVKRCETLKRQRKDEVLAVEIDVRNNIMSVRIIQSSYIPRNFLCDKVFRLSVSQLLSL